MLGMNLTEFLDSIPVGHRRPRFQDLAEAMLNLHRPVVIVETGCMRISPSNESPELDGCSTLVWDYVAQQSEGKCISIDIDQKNIDYARTKVSRFTHLVCGDSLRVLAGIDRLTRPIDFLYLDSMDWQGTPVEKSLSALHHAAELSAVWHWLAHDALIAVDDCMEPYKGKHEIVKRFFDSVGVQPLTDDYIHVWRKPFNAGIALVPKSVLVGAEPERQFQP